MTVFCHEVGLARKKTTVYVDEDLLRAAKVYAARKDLRDSDVFEEKETGACQVVCVRT